LIIFDGNQLRRLILKRTMPQRKLGPIHRHEVLAARFLEPHGLSTKNISVPARRVLDSSCDDMPGLSTERLVHRPFISSDSPEVERLAGNRFVADTTLAIPHPLPRRRRLVDRDARGCMEHRSRDGAGDLRSRRVGRAAGRHRCKSWVAGSHHKTSPDGDQSDSCDRRSDGWVSENAGVAPAQPAETHS
jgi:hypothetical protein